MAEPAVYPKYRDTTADAVAPYLAIPEVQAGPVPLVHHDGGGGGGHARHLGPAADVRRDLYSAWSLAAGPLVPDADAAGSGAGR